MSFFPISILLMLYSFEQAKANENRKLKGWTRRSPSNLCLLCRMRRKEFTMRIFRKFVHLNSPRPSNYNMKAINNERYVCPGKLTSLFSYGFQRYVRTAVKH